MPLSSLFVLTFLSQTGETAKPPAKDCIYDAPRLTAQVVRQIKASSLSGLKIDEEKQEARGFLANDLVFIKWWTCDRMARDVWLLSVYPPAKASDRAYWERRLRDLASATLPPSVQSALKAGRRSEREGGKEYRIEAQPAESGRLEALVLDDVELVTVRINWTSD